MAMVNVVTIAAYRRNADLLAQADRLGPKVGSHLVLRATFVRWTGWTLAVAVHCYDDSTINIVMAIIIIIIIIHYCELLWSTCVTVASEPAACWSSVCVWTAARSSCKPAQDVQHSAAVSHVTGTISCFFHCIAVHCVRCSTALIALPLPSIYTCICYIYHCHCRQSTRAFAGLPLGP